MQEAVKAPTQAVVDATTKANAAAQKVTTVQKPYNDALAAMKVSTTAQNLASQQHVIAARRAEIRTGPRAGCEAGVDGIRRGARRSEEATRGRHEGVHRRGSRHPLGLLFARRNDLADRRRFSQRSYLGRGNGNGRRCLRGPCRWLAAVGFLDDERLLSIGADQSLRIWQRNPAWRLERTIGAVDQPDVISDRVLTLDFNANASQLLVGGGVPSRNGELQIFNVADGTRLFYLPQAHDDVIHARDSRPTEGGSCRRERTSICGTFDIASSQMLRRIQRAYELCSGCRLERRRPDTGVIFG